MSESHAQTQNHKGTSRSQHIHRQCKADVIIIIILFKMKCTRSYTRDQMN